MNMMLSIMFHFLNLFFILSFAGVAFSGELRPLELPSQKYLNVPPQSVEQAKPQPPVDESVYLEFEKKVKEMSTTEKEELKVRFREKRDLAARKESWEEVRYYNRLFDILEKK